MRWIWVRVGLAVVGLSFVIELVARGFVTDPIQANFVTMGVASGVLGVAVATAVSRRRSDSLGLLLAVVVGLGGASVWRYSTNSWAASAGELVFLAAPLVGLLLVAAALGPSVSTTRVRTLVAVAAGAAALGVAAILTAADGLPGWVVAGRDESVENRLAIFSARGASLALLDAWAVVVALGALLGTIVALGSWARSPSKARRADTPVAMAALAWAVTVAACALSVQSAETVDTTGVLSTGAAVALPFLGIAGLSCALGWAELVRPRLTRARGGVLELPAEGVPGAELGTWLRQLTGDPTLEVRYASGDGWVDPSGRAQDLPADDEERDVLILRRDGSPFVALVHHPATPTDVLALAARLAVASIDAERSSALARSRAEAVRAVTARLVHAGDAAAQRLTEDLLAGPVSELAVLAQDLRTDPATLAGAAARLRTIAAEVRTLSHGLYPPALADGGLVAALDEHSGVPERRYPAVVEHTVYLLAADDIDAGIAESPGELRVALTRAPRPSDADRVVVLGGSIDGLVVTIPVESGQEAAA